MAVNILEQVRSFLTAPKLDEALSALAHNPAQPPIRTSWVWDSHITESVGGGSKGKLPQSVSLSWDENEARGIESSMRSWQGLTPRERKEILLAMYIANVSVSSCVNVIANRICSAGFTVEKVSEETKDNQEHYDQLMNFCLRVNDDWDFLQFSRASIRDKLIFGENYAEMTWKDGVPFQLFKVDCIGMHYRIDRTGRVLRYEQQLMSSSQINQLDPKNIIRWWEPSPHASVDPFSPMELVTDPINLDKKMVNWISTFFQKGAKFPYWIEFPGSQDEAQRFLEWFRQNYTGEKNAHLPPIAYDGTKLNEFKGGALDIDFPGGRDRNQTQVLMAYHVPPAAVSLIESGNIGGGTGEDQDKSLQYNACDPVKHDFLEKLNYRIVQQGFGIKDYRIGLRYADFRNDEQLAKVQDTHIRNGLVTINEARAEMGKKPYKDGGDVGIVVASKDVFPVPRITDMEDEQKQSAQLDIEAKQVANDKAKNPPEPTMLPGQTNQPGKPNQGNVSKKANNVAAKRQQAGSKKEESIDAQTTQPPAHQQSHARLTLLTQATDTQEGTTEAGEVRGATTEDAQHTGIMIAFFLEPDAAQKLALPKGEPAGDLHVTLAFLGDMADFKGDIDRLKRELTSFASEATPLQGYTGGLGRFIPSESSDGMTPVIALVNVIGLQKWRDALVKRLEGIDVKPANDFDFTPHITLAYIDEDDPLPVESVPHIPLAFDTLWLAIGDDRIPFKLGGEPQQQQESANEQSDRDKLASALAAIFLAEQASGRLTTDEQNYMANLLEGAYMAARSAAYDTAFQAIGSDATWEPALADVDTARQWAQEQVASIASTFEESIASLRNADSTITPDEIAGAVEQYTSWKAPQIANVTIGSGANAGTRSAVDDMLEALTSVDIDTSLIPDGLSAESIRVRVVPEASSSDFCADWAGQDFPLDQAGDIPFFPSHPNCQHSLEVYVVGGQDEPEE